MRFRLLISAVAFSAASLMAHADTFNFSFGQAGDAFYGSGTLTASLIAGTNNYQVTAITGTTDTLGLLPLISDHTISGLASANSFQSNDNVLVYQNGAYTFDSKGLSYALKDGAQISLHADANGNLQGLERALLLGINSTESVGLSITPTATSPTVSTSVTPEPSSLALLGTGVLGAAGVIRRRLV